MKIVQVLDYFASGNGVANCAVMYYKMTVRLGIDSAIVARLIDKKEWYVKEISYLDQLDENDIVMYHMCIGTQFNQIICSYDFKKVLVYHNITPPSMIEQYDYTIANACREGLVQLGAMKNSFSVCLAMSEFNKRDLIRYGYQKDLITVIPPYTDKEDYQRKPDRKTMQKYSDGWTNIVFVGRISPNKKHEDLIRIFRYYKTRLNPHSRLILAGSVGGKYYDKLQRYIEKLNIQDVIFTEQISFAKLLAIYQTASVFLCVSEHEGYCIPLIEAMCFDIPVIAYDACAVGDTMGRAGILLKDKNPELAAKVIHEVCNNDEFRQRVIQSQRVRIRSVTKNAVFQKYKKWVNTLPDQFEKLSAESDGISEKNCNPYNVVMVVKADDWDMAKHNLKYIRKYLKPKQIVIIASSKMRSLLNSNDHVRFLDEDQLYEGLTFEKIREFFALRQMSLSSTGWYLQQFLKLAYAFVCKDEYYLVWDADTIPLREIPMLDPQTGRPYFDMKPEYIASYFSSIRNLTGMEKVETESFIAEHMLFRTQIVRQMITAIEQNHYICGMHFFDKILCAADYSERERAFSEFELYGTFCKYVYPNLYQKRHLRTMRCGKMFLGAVPKKEVLQWAAKDKDTISFEYPQQVIERSRILSESKKFRNRYSIDDLIKRVYLLDRLTFPEWMRQETEALKMDYPWAGQALFLQSCDYKAAEEKKKKAYTIKIVIFGGSEDIYFLGVLFAHRGMHVTLVQEGCDARSVKRFQKFWGFQILFRNVYPKYLDIVQKLPEDIRFQFAFFSAEQLGQYDQYNKNLKNAKKWMILEHSDCLDMDAIKNLQDVSLLNTSLLKSDALLWGKKESMLELWDHRENSGMAGLLFSDRIQVKKFDDKDVFLDHVQCMNKYMDELELLKQKYRMK